MTIEFAFIAFNIMLVAVVFHLLPSFRKRSLLFAVTVDDSFRASEEARTIRRDYRLMIWSGTLLTLGALWWAMHSAWTPVLGLVPLVQVVFAVSAWVISWRRVRPHATRSGTGERTVSFGEPERGIPGGWLALLLPFAGPIAAAWHLWSRYEELPVRYPVHWNAAGHADRFAEKSLLTVFFPSVMTVAVMLLLVAMAVGIQRGTRRGSSGERAGWAMRHRRLNLWMLVVILWILSAMLSVTAFGAVIPPDTMRVLIWACVGLLLAAVLAFLIPLISMSMEATGGNDATPDECWRWGTFYYNREDPAFLVEKRDGPGFTINFANRLSWALLVLVALLTVAPIVMAIYT